MKRTCTPKKVIEGTIQRSYKRPSHKMPVFKIATQPAAAFGSLGAILKELRIVTETQTVEVAVVTPDEKENIFNRLDSLISKAVTSTKQILKLA